jgi:hypothetical protein
MPSLCLRRPATPIRAASALPSSFTRAKSCACAGNRRIASARAASFAPSLPCLMPIARFQAAGAICVAGMPAAPKTPSITPRERPNANAPTAPSPGLAATNSMNASLAWALKTISATSGALTARRATAADCP